MADMSVRSEWWITHMGRSTMLKPSFRKIALQALPTSRVQESGLKKRKDFFLGYYCCLLISDHLKPSHFFKLYNRQV